MGNCNFKTEYENDNVTGKSLLFVMQSTIAHNFVAVNKNHFLFHYVIGRGGFGKVWKVEKKKEKKLFAMKEMHKGRIIAKRSVNSVMNEKKFLT
jgi:serine/threonine protein kinase